MEGFNFLTNKNVQNIFIPPEAILYCCFSFRVSTDKKASPQYDATTTITCGCEHGVVCVLQLAFCHSQQVLTCFQYLLHDFVVFFQC